MGASLEQLLRRAVRGNPIHTLDFVMRRGDEAIAKCARRIFPQRKTIRSIPEGQNIGHLLPAGIPSMAMNMETSARDSVRLITAS